MEGEGSEKVGISHRIVFLIAVFFTGAVAGAFLWAVLFCMNIGISAIWDRVPIYLGDLYPLIVCIIGGVVIGLFAKCFGPYPDSLPQVMAKVKSTGRYEYKDIGKMSVAALLPLVFGGSVGPEAGLTGVIAAVCTWVGDRMKRLGSEVREMTEVGMYAALSAIFVAPLFGFAGVAGKSDAPKPSRIMKIVIYVFAITGALLALLMLSHHVGGSLSLPRYGHVDYSMNEVLWLVPICLVGAIGGWIFSVSDVLFERLAVRFGERCVLKAVTGGIVLGICGIVLPLTMFSGELQAEEINVTWMTMSASVLLLTGFVKIPLTAFCVNMGWRGGHFFPVIFSGIAIGYGLALLIGVDPVLAVCATTAAVVGGVTRKPLMAVLLLFLCFPVYDVVILAIAAVIGAYLPLPKFAIHGKPSADEE